MKSKPAGASQLTRNSNWKQLLKQKRLPRVSMNKVPKGEIIFEINIISVYTLSDLGVLSNLIGSLSLAN